MTQPQPPNPAQPIKFTSRVRRGLADVRALVLASFDPSAPPSTAQTTKWSADRRRDFNLAMDWIDQQTTQPASATEGGAS